MLDLHNLVLLCRRLRHLWGLRGRSAAPTTPVIATGGKVCSSAVDGVASLASGASTIAAVSTSKVLTFLVVASVAVADAPVVCANDSSSPGPLAAAASPSSVYRALEDSQTGAVGIFSTEVMGLGVALRNIGFSVIKKIQRTILLLQGKYTYGLVFRLIFLNRRCLPDPPGAAAWSAFWEDSCASAAGCCSSRRLGAPPSVRGSTVIPSCCSGTLVVCVAGISVVART